MVTEVVITKWEGCGKDSRVRDTTNGTDYLLNGNRINGLEIRASTKSKFMFVDELHNPKEKASYIEATEAVGTIQTEINKTWQDQFARFDFYTNNDTSLATFSRYIHVDSFAYAYKNPQSTTLTYIVYYEGGKRMELLCNKSLKTVRAIFDTGAITTSAG